MPVTSTDVLQDGFSTTLAIADISSVNIEIISINLPGLNGGGQIDTTTMSNTAWRTNAAKSLKTLDSVTAEVAYSTDAYEDIIAEINDNQLMTLTLPDTSTFAFYGYIDTFVPAAFSEGERPTATMTIIPTLRDDSHAETAPVYTIPTGAT